MRKSALIAAALAVLAFAGAAVANLKQAGVDSASATFTAPAARVDTRTCTGADGTYEITRGTYAGTATSSTPSLAGPVEIKVTSVYNTTKKLGWVEGWYKTRSSEGRSNAKLLAVNSNGTLDGSLYGVAGNREARLIASLTSGFTAAGGFAGSQVGSGSSANAGVLAGRPACKAEKEVIAVKLAVRGTVEAVSDTSISVKPLDGSAVQTCAITSRSPRKDVEKGDRVTMLCAQLDGQMVLVKLDRKRGD